MSFLLFFNDGLLDANHARSLIVPKGLKFDDMRMYFSQSMYGTPSTTTRLFTCAGKEILSENDLQLMQSIVVSLGEDYICGALTSATSFPEFQQQLNLYPSYGATSNITSYDTMIQNDDAMRTPAIRSDMLSSATCPLGFFNDVIESPVTSSVPSSLGASPIDNQFNISSSAQRTTADLSSLDTMFNSDNNCDEAASSSKNDDTVHFRQHKISERKSREKLRQSINDLVLCLPSLPKNKRHSKATVIQKAAEYLRLSQKREAQLNSERAAKDFQIRALELQKQQLQLQKLRVSHQLYSSAITSVEIVDRSYLYIFVDKMWEFVNGYESCEVLGKRFRDINKFRNCPLMEVMRNQIRVSLETEGSWSGVIISQRKDGRPHVSEASIQPTIVNGNITQFVCMRKNFHMLTREECKKFCAQDWPSISKDNCDVEALLSKTLTCGEFFKFDEESDVSNLKQTNSGELLCRFASQLLLSTKLSLSAVNST